MKMALNVNNLVSLIGRRKKMVIGKRGRVRKAVYIEKVMMCNSAIFRGGTISALFMGHNWGAVKFGEFLLSSFYSSNKISPYWKHIQWENRKIFAPFLKGNEWLRSPIFSIFSIQLPNRIPNFYRIHGNLILCLCLSQLLLSRILCGPLLATCSSPGLTFKGDLVRVFTHTSSN